MSGQSGRNRGCWTCRLRRLKCDEGHDNCERCTSCGIPCYGYGVKPAWKDGGIREAEKLATIKAGVAKNKRKRALAARSKKNINEELTDSPDDASRSPASGDQIVYGSSANETQHVPFISPSTESWLSFSQSPTGSATESIDVVQALAQHQIRLNLTGRETELFQHYLDYVFRLQYFHQKCLTQNSHSRHWFLSLLQNTPPLQHAAISLSALHLLCLQEREKEQGSTPTAEKNRTLMELEAYRTAALQGLRAFIRDYESVSLTVGYLPILAGCSQLLSYDIFQGGVDQWQVHLEAATNLVLQKASCSELIPAAETEPDVKEANIFLVGALIWSDILACASTGRRPMLYNLIPRLIGRPESGDSLIQMENIMGCENQVMALISDISALQEWKIDCLSSRCCSIWDLTTRSRGILNDLEAAILALEIRLRRLGLCFTNDITFSQNPIITVIITNIFATAAVVYLHVVVCGVQPALPEIRENVERTISAMKRIPKSDRGKLARGVLWPACVAGSVAEARQQPFFRDFLNDAVNDSRGFGNAQTAVEILEASWDVLNQEERSTSSICSVPLKPNYLLQGWPQILQQNGHKALLV